MKVQNKLIAVTGGGSGIGRELVMNLLSKWAKLMASDIYKTSLSKTPALAGKKKEYLAV